MNEILDKQSFSRWLWNDELSNKKAVKPNSLYVSKPSAVFA